jgi:hypothetical protein
MGFIDTSTDDTLPVFFNVVHAVGRQCPNFRDDVKLIQYLLIAFYAKSETVLHWKKPPGELTVTGECNTTTLNWIQHFQMDIRKGLGKGTLDGRVDRVRNKNLIGTISGETYTLVFLNRSVMNFNPDAFVLTPTVIPLENPMNVPPPSNDMVRGAPTSKVGGA